MQYTEWEVTGPAREVARCCWTLHHDASFAESPPESSSDAEPALPDGCLELIFNFGDPFEHVAANGERKPQPRCFLVGQITAPFVVRPTGSIDLLAVRLEANGARGLHPDLSRLCNAWAPVEALHEASLVALWQTLPTLPRAERGDAVTQWLTAYTTRLATRRGTRSGMMDETVQAVVDMICADASTEKATDHDSSSDALGRTMTRIAAGHGVSLRTLQRHFLQQVGVSPKLLARLVRFHRVCLAWRHDPATLARVAASCGYFDESHLVRDFRAFVGEPPVSFLNALPAFTAVFLSTPRSV